MAKTDNGSPSKDIKFIKELMKLLEDSSLNDLDYDKGDLSIRLSKGNTQYVAATNMAAPAPTAAIAAPDDAATSSQPTASTELPKDAAAHPGAVKSPMVGTAYLRPSPDAEPFCQAGDKVQEGDTILLIEAMKTYNPIVAPKSGKIETILVKGEAPVEFGEPLFIII